MGIRMDQSLDEAAQSARIADLLQNEGYTMTYLTDLDKRVEDLRLEVEHEWLKLDKAQRAEVSDLRANFFSLQANIKLLQFEHPEQQRRFKERLHKPRPIRTYFLRLGREKMKEIEKELGRKEWRRWDKRYRL